jgi:DNA-binding transcriptional LysR family regulator
LLAVTFVRGGATRAALDHLFPEAKVVVELSGVAAVKQHVRQSVGVALLARSAAGDDLQTGRMRALRHPATPVARYYAIAHRGRDRLSPAAAALRTSLLASAPRIPMRRRAR